MKISVSIPDDLWQSVATPDASPSQTVQEALRHVALSRATSEDRIAEVTQRVLSRLDDGRGDPLTKLVDDALEVRERGYGIGLEVGKELSWTDLEALPSGAELRTGLFAALNDQPAPARLEDLRDRWWQAVSEWEVALATDEFGEPMPSRLLVEAITDGLDDLRHAVLARLQQTHASSEDEQ